MKGLTSACKAFNPSGSVRAGQTASRGLLTGVVVMLLASTGCRAAPDPAAAVPTSTAPVVRIDIISRQQLNGTLTFAGLFTLINQATGVYTALPSPGTVVSRGQALYRVDSRPIPLFYGNPEWRTLSVGVPDGADVTELEQNLLALGFGDSSNLIAGGHFDAFDAAAVRRWQASLGVTQTGVVNLGDGLVARLAPHYPSRARLARTSALAHSVAAAIVGCAGSCLHSHSQCPR